MNESLINELQRKLGADKILLGAAVAERYEHIAQMEESEQAMAVALPNTRKEASIILKACLVHNQETVVHGELSNLENTTKADTLEVEIFILK